MPGNIKGKGWLAVTATVKGEEAIYVEFEAGLADADIRTNSTGGVFGNIHTLSCGTIKASTFRTKLSGVTAASFQA